MAAVAALLAPVTAQAQEAGSTQGTFSDDDGSVHEPALEEVAAKGWLAGTECGEGLICPKQPLKRWELAVWLGRALSDGADPDAITVSRFADVDPSQWWAAHVERFAELGITTGCKQEPLNYCPNDPVTRAQMATFLTRALVLPASPSADFTDTEGNTHTANIDALAAAEITTGCEQEPLNYCPNDPVTRAQMATFLTRATNRAQWSTRGEYKAVGANSALAENETREYSCGLRYDGRIECWGYNKNGETDAPSGVFKAITVGNHHSCAIRVDDTITCWGWNRHGQTNAPSGTFKAIAAGTAYGCAIRTDDTITCWGINSSGEADAPSGTFKAVVTGFAHGCAIRTDDTITCWGWNGHGQTNAPSGTFKAIAAGTLHSCGIATDDTLTCWGNNDFGQANSPSQKYKAVSAGGSYNCAIRLTDTAFCWGTGVMGSKDFPAGTFTDISAGITHTCGVRTDGTIVCWGGQTLIINPRSAE